MLLKGIFGGRILQYIPAYLTLAGGSAVTMQERLAPCPTPEWTVSSSAVTSGLSAKKEKEVR